MTFSLAITRRKVKIGSKEKSKSAKLKDSSLRKVRQYQKRTVEIGLREPELGIFADPGTGKTSIILRILLALKDARIPWRRALVIAPKRVIHRVWPIEPGEWKGTEWERLGELTFAFLHGNRKEEEAERDADIYLTTPDSLEWVYDNWKQLRKKIGVLVVDESSKFRNYKSKRFTTLKPLLKHFEKRFALTGSPNPRSYLNLWSQMYIINCGKSLGQFITHYKRAYFYQDAYDPYNWKLLPGAEKHIQKAISPYLVRLDAKDYLELPALNENIVRIDLPEDIREIYDSMESELVAKVNGGEVTAANAGVATIKCAQIANGGIYREEFNDSAGVMVRWMEHLHEEKIDAVRDKLEELDGSPAMVTYEYDHDLERLQEAFGPDIPVMGGGTSEKAWARIEDDWNASKIPILFAHWKSVSHGLNLQKGAAQHIIGHSLTYSYEEYDQLVRRLLRQGSNHKNIFFHFIVARNTVDEAKLTTIRSRRKDQNAFLDALKKYIRSRGNYVSLLKR